MLEGSLPFLLAGRMSMLATLAFILSLTGVYGRIFRRELRWKEYLLMVLFFSRISIAGNYVGVPVHGALPNARAISAMVGGPLVGGAAGLISGVHRYFLGGFTAFPCGLATFLEGLAGGDGSEAQPVLAGFLAGGPFLHRRGRGLPHAPDPVTGPAL